MKKIIFGLIATVMVGATSFGQMVNSKNKIATTVKLTAKFHGVITYLESADRYKDGMSVDEFVKGELQGVEDEKLIDIFTPYFQNIYTFHKAGLTADMVYDKIDGEGFTRVVNDLRIYQEETGNGATPMKIRWLNAIRKFIDWVDDTFGEAIDGPKAPVAPAPAPKG